MEKKRNGISWEARQSCNTQTFLFNENTHLCMDEKYFERIDKELHKNPKGQWLLYLAVIFCATFMFTQVLFSGAAHLQTYGDGLTIQYKSDASQFDIEFTNTDADVMNMVVAIYLDYNTNNPTSIYESEYTSFPVHVTYSPYVKDSEHTVSVTLTRPTGKYSYIYSMIPARSEMLNFGLFK